MMNTNIRNAIGVAFVVILAMIAVLVAAFAYGYWHLALTA